MLATNSSKKTFYKFLCLLLVFTILFIPFSRPKKANAFVGALIAGTATLIVGSVILLSAGLSYLDGQSRNAEAERLIKEHGDKIEFHFNTITGDKWISGDVITDYSGWDGNFRMKEEFPNILDDFVANTPTAGTSIVAMPADVITVPWRGGAYYNVQVAEEGSKPILNVNGKDISFIKYGYPNIEKLDYYTNPVRCYTQVWDKPGDGSVYNIQVQGIDLEILYGSQAVIKSANSNTVITQDFTLDYSTAINDDAYSKERLTTTLPTSTTIDVSNVDAKTLPTTVAKDDVIPNVNVDTDSKVITGWKWLDNVLQGILGLLKGILDGILAIPRGIIAIKDWCVALPQTISTWWEGLWTDVPSIDWSPLIDLNLQNVFPFSIPFDLKNLFSIFLAEPKAPVWDIPILGQKITLDLRDFDSIASIVRIFVIVGFSFYLINRHKQMEE